VDLDREQVENGGITTPTSALDRAGTRYLAEISSGGWCHLWLPIGGDVDRDPGATWLRPVLPPGGGRKKAQGDPRAHQAPPTKGGDGGHIIAPHFFPDRSCLARVQDGRLVPLSHEEAAREMEEFHQPDSVTNQILATEPAAGSAGAAPAGNKKDNKDKTKGDQ